MTPSSTTLIRDPWRRLWHFFAGDGFLAAMVSVIAILLLLATYLPQIPTADPISYSRWLSDAQTRFGNGFGLLTTLGFFSVTNSLLFRLALALLGWCFALRLMDHLDRLRQPDRPVARRSNAAVLLVYGGALLLLLGLVIGTFVDYRVDSIVVAPGSATNLPGTPYTLRLDEVENDHALVVLLNQTETIAQGTLAPRQPLRDSVMIYLDQIGPALKVSATRGTTQTLDLQNTANSLKQPQVLLVFTPNQPENFVAAPQTNLVLRVQQAGPAQFTAQVYQSATGKDLGSQPFKSGDALTVEGNIFTFEPAAYITVSIVNQPSHWIIALGLIVSMLGLMGILIWPSESPPSRAQRLAWSVTRVSWPIWTIVLVAQLIAVYPRTASFGQAVVVLIATLSAWLSFSGSVITQHRARLILLILGVLAAIWAIFLWIGSSR